MTTDSGIKNGKKPLSQKQGPCRVTADEIYGNATALSEELKKELEEQGLVPHWVDYKQMKELDGYHRSGWQIYFRKNHANIDNQEAKFGRSPDGIVRRGTLVLAVKTKESAEKHKAYLKDRAERYSGKIHKKQAEEFRQLAKQSGLNTTVETGYDD
jgi:hypothetical protein